MDLNTIQSKKEGNSATSDNINELKMHLLTVINQTEKHKCCMASLICGIYKKERKSWTHSSNSKMATDSQVFGEIRVW